MEGLALGTINLIVLPILGGYWFQYKFNLTHYRAERLTPQRLLFHAGLYALGLVTVARLMVFVADLSVQPSLSQNLLCLSMKDGKVYIGFIQELPANPEDRNSYLEILPLQSGYRDKDTREMKLTTFYQSAYTNLLDSNADEEAWLVFSKILKIDDILSAGRFDPEAYVKFNEKPVGAVREPRIDGFLLDDGSG
jgi:hypothetical protein